MNPNFVGVGAQKSGTSWIYACLEEHPDICMPVKEIHYFSKQERFDKGLEWYGGHFKACKPGQIVGEFSTTYIHSEQALERIFEAYPECKIIVSIRDPISRAESHFNNDIRAGFISKSASFEQSLNETPEYWRRGLYHNKINWLIEHFGRDKVYVAVLEDTTIDPARFISEIYNFLDVDPSFSPPALMRKINISAIPRSVFLGRLLDNCASLLRRLGLSRVIQFLRTKGFVERVRKANMSSMEIAYDMPHWSLDILAKLEQDRVLLEGLLARSLAHWRSVELFKGYDSKN